MTGEVAPSPAPLIVPADLRIYPILTINVIQQLLFHCGIIYFVLKHQIFTWNICNVNECTCTVCNGGHTHIHIVAIL